MNFIDKTSGPLRCSLCHQDGSSSGCLHKGTWHSQFEECGVLCGVKLGLKNLGKQHYSCCYSTDIESKCMKSQHVFNEYNMNDTDLVPDDSDEINIRVSDCPRYIVNLDAPPKERWNHIIKDFACHFPPVLEFIDAVLGSGVKSDIVTSIVSGINKLGKFYYSEEIEGIAEASGYPVGKIALLQIAYEVFAACTSIVVDMPCDELNKSTGNSASSETDTAPFHIRTMDWEMNQLKDLTIEVDFVKEGHILARTTTWAGYVGILTGMKPQVASVSVNYRRTLAGSRNMIAGVFRNMLKGLGKSWPVSFLVRETLIDKRSFREVVDQLQSKPLMAPTYITVAGAHPGEGIVITRDRESTVHPWSLDTDGFIVQTNMDHFNINPAEGNDRKYDWQNICHSRQRVQAARLAITHMTETNKLRVDSFWDLLSISPCLADDTIFTVAMCPMTGMYVTRHIVTRTDKRNGKSTWQKVFRKLHDTTEEGGAKRI